MNIELKDLREETMLAISIRTPVKLNKKDKEGNKNELDPIFKIQNQIVVVNKSYEDTVNNHRFLENKESNFESQGRKWGTQDGCIVTKEDGTQYLSYILLNTVGEPVYQYENGDVVLKETFAQYMPAFSPSKNQGVEVEVKARTVKLGNIIQADIV